MSTRYIPPSFPTTDMTFGNAARRCSTSTDRFSTSYNTNSFFCRLEHLMGMRAVVYTFGCLNVGYKIGIILEDK